MIVIGLITKHFNALLSNFLKSCFLTFFFKQTSLSKCGVHLAFDL